MGIEVEVDAATKRKLAALAAALASEPGGIDAQASHGYVFIQNKAGNVGVDEHGRRRLTAWGQKGRRDSTGAWS